MAFSSGVFSTHPRSYPFINDGSAPNRRAHAVPHGELGGRVYSPSPQQDSELLALIEKIEEAQAVSHNVTDKTTVLVVGNTGSGKSTFVNYMAGRRFKRDDNALQANVKCLRPIFMVGHGKDSCTAIPQIYFDRFSQLAFCDCPGFFDNRSLEFEIVNSVSMSCLARQSREVKCIILCMEYAALINMRRKDMDEGLKRTTEFLKGANKEDSIFLLLTKTTQGIEDPEKAVTELASYSSFVKSLAEHDNIGFYSPLDDCKGNRYVYNRASLKDKIKRMQPICDPENKFKVTLSTEAINRIDDLICSATTTGIQHLTSGDYPSLAKLVRSVFSLRNMGNNVNRVEFFRSTLKARIESMQCEDSAKQKLERLCSHLPEFESTIFVTLQKVEDRSRIEAVNRALVRKLQSTRKKIGKLEQQLSGARQQCVQQGRRVENYRTQLENMTKQQEQAAKTARENEARLRRLLAEKSGEIGHLSSELTRLRQERTRSQRNSRPQPQVFVVGSPFGHYGMSGLRF